MYHDIAVSEIHSQHGKLTPKRPALKLSMKTQMVEDGEACKQLLIADERILVGVF